MQKGLVTNLIDRIVTAINDTTNTVQTEWASEEVTTVMVQETGFLFAVTMNLEQQTKQANDSS